MFNKMYVLFSDIFFNAEKNGTDCWLMLSLSVPLILLFELYNRSLLEGLIPIEELPTEKKLEYYTIACKYYSENEEQIKASKAAYMLSLITSTN